MTTTMQIEADMTDDVQGYLGFVAHAVLHLGHAVLTGAGIIYGQTRGSGETAQVPNLSDGLTSSASHPTKY